jgi:hypothetical protein
MHTVDIPLPPGRDLTSVPARVQAVCRLAGLRPTLEGTLRSYPGSRHWHYQQGRAPGTLEVTWWPARQRLWLKVAVGRAGAWTGVQLPALQAALTQAMHSLPVLVAVSSIER